MTYIYEMLSPYGTTDVMRITRQLMCITGHMNIDCHHPLKPAPRDSRLAQTVCKSKFFKQECGNIACPAYYYIVDS